MGELVGDKVYNEFGNEFPLLIKFIDANDKLSIQVHPDDSLARKRGEKRGKTEMWYVLEAEENAKLISGFKRKTDPHEYRELLQANKLDEILNVEDVKNGDVFYMPAGRVHAILPGILLAEIQQTSDTTYRIYDYDRKDASGKKRDLHIEEAMDAIDFKVYDNYKTKYHAPKNQTVDLIDEKYFSTNLIYYNQAIERNIEEIDSFIIYMVVEGSLEMQASEQREKLNRGDVVLIPAITNKLNIIPKSECKLLEIYIKNEVKIGESSIELEINS
jgi:mannose-6-phosphate isomerase